MSKLLAADGRVLIVAIDHPMYSWPCRGLENPERVISAAASSGADAIISTYGTIRNFRSAFASAQPILKLDLTTVTLGGEYPVSEYVQAWSLEDAKHLGVEAVLTFVQLGASFELEALRLAARVAADADRAGMTYVCEIMPVQSERFPKDDEPIAIAAAVRTASEIGATMIKTTMPDPPEAITQAVGSCAPVVLAGGALTNDQASMLESASTAINAGASGLAFGRNVWAAADPASVVAKLRQVVHPSEEGTDAHTVPGEGG